MKGSWMKKGKRIYHKLAAGITIFIFLSLWVFLSSSLTGPVSSLAAAQTEFLADRHKKIGVECQGCHQENPPSKPVMPPICLSCHGDYEKVAAQTEKVHPNPHASHEGNLPCNVCHNAHKVSKDHCATCHNFDFKIP
jgi:hypothetical protein